MFDVRRVGAIAVLLALLAISTSTHVWGEPGRDKDSKENGDGRNHLPPKGDARFAEKIGISRFTNQPVLLYEAVKGDKFIAVQLKPTLEPLPARPRDILVL